MSSSGRNRCRELCDEAIDLATRLIQLNDDLFLIPASLAEDISHNRNASMDSLEAKTTHQRQIQEHAPEDRVKHAANLIPSLPTSAESSRKTPSPVRTVTRFTSSHRTFDSPIPGEPTNPSNVLVEVSKNSCHSVSSFLNTFSAFCFYLQKMKKAYF